MARVTMEMHEELQDDILRLGKGAGIALVGRIGGRALLLASQVLLAHLLGPAEFGLFALGWTILQMGSLIIPLGLHEGVIRYGSRYWRIDNRGFRAVLQKSLEFVTLLGLSSSLVLFTGASWLACEVFQKPNLMSVFRGIAIALALVAILRVAAAGTRVSQQMQFSVIAEGLTPPAVQLLSVILLVVWARWGLQGAVLSVNLGFAVGVGLAFVFLWRLVGRELHDSPSSEFSFKELIAFSLTASLAGIFTMLTLRVDRLMVGYFLPAADVGIYQAASQAAMLSAMILGAFNAIFSPMIARLYHEGQMERLNELFKISTKWGLYVSLPLFLVLVVVPREVMTVVFGQAYAAGAIPMLVMAGAQLINASTGAVGFLLTMTGHPNRWLALSAASFVINITLGVTLISRMGVVGAALAAATAVVLLFLGGLFQVRRLLHLWPYDRRRYLKGMIAASVTIAVLFFSKSFLKGKEIHSLIRVLGLVLIDLFTFLSILVGLGFDTEDKLIIRFLGWFIFRLK